MVLSKVDAGDGRPVTCPRRRTVDLEAGLENLILNQIEDAIIGGIHSGMDRMLPGYPMQPTKWQNNPTKPAFEKEVAAWVEETFGDAVRDFVEIPSAKGTTSPIGDWVRGGRFPPF